MSLPVKPVHLLLISDQKEGPKAGGYVSEQQCVQNNIDDLLELLFQDQFIVQIVPHLKLVLVLLALELAHRHEKFNQLDAVEHALEEDFTGRYEHVERDHADEVSAEVATQIFACDF